mgnify:CR=1 FL=1
MEFDGITRVKVEGAPGYEDFEGVLLLVSEGMDSRGDLAIIASEGEQHVISTRYITEL